MLETFRDRISKKNIDRCLSRNCQMNLFGEIFNSDLKECNKVVVLVFVAAVVVAVVAVLAVGVEVGVDAAVVAGEVVVSVDEDVAIVVVVCDVTVAVVVVVFYNVAAVVVFAANAVAFQMPAMLDIFLKKI